MDNAFQDKDNYPKNKGGKKNNRQNNKREFKPPKKITEKYLYNAGLAYLQRFPASSAHFKTVMMRKVDRSCRHHQEQDRNQCEEWLDNLVVKFKDLALLDDTLYLKGMVTSYRRRGLAARQIEAKLYQKGLAKDDITKAITEYDRDEIDDKIDGEQNGDFHAALIYARKKRLGAYDVMERHTPEKSLATLARAGYSYDIAQKVLSLTQEEIEEISTTF